MTLSGRSCRAAVAPPQTASHSATRPILATIVVPTYCAEATLSWALRSALDQFSRCVTSRSSSSMTPRPTVPWGLINSLVAERSPRLRGDAQ